MAEQRPLTDAEGTVVNLTWIETTEDNDGLPNSIDCPTETALVQPPLRPDDGEDEDVA